MQTFGDLEHMSSLLNACIYYEILVSVWMIMKKNIFNDVTITLKSSDSVLQQGNVAPRNRTVFKRHVRYFENWMLFGD